MARRREAIGGAVLPARMALRAAVFQSVTTSPLAGMPILDARFIAPMQAIKRKPLKKAFIAAFSCRRTAARLYALTGFCVKLVPSHSFQSRRLMGHPSRLSSVFIPFGVLTPAAHGLMHVEAYDANPSHAGEDAGLSTRSEPEWHLPCTRTVTTGARVFSMLEAETRDRFRRDLAWSI